MKRKIYVASSWRNGYYPEVVAKLREAGHEVYDFRNPPSGDPGFKWSSVSEDYMEWSPQQYRDMLQHITILLRRPFHIVLADATPLKSRVTRWRITEVIHFVSYLPQPGHHLRVIPIAPTACYIYLSLSHHFIIVAIRIFEFTSRFSFTFFTKNSNPQHSFSSASFVLLAFICPAISASKKKG